jgi:Competence-damaged protein
MTSVSTTGGLISAVAVPGASAYFLGGAIVYRRRAKSLTATERCRNFVRRPSRTRCCWRGARRCNSRRHGHLAKPAPPGRAAIAMAIQPDTLVSRSRERPSGCARWKPGGCPGVPKRIWACGTGAILDPRIFQCQSVPMPERYFPKANKIVPIQGALILY